MIFVRRNLVQNISLLKQNNDKTLVEQCVVNSYSMCAYISPRGIHTRKVCYSINSGNSRALIHGVLLYVYLAIHRNMMVCEYILTNSIIVELYVNMNLYFLSNLSSTSQRSKKPYYLWAETQKPLTSSFIIAILLLLLLLDGGCATNITQSDEN